MSDIQRGQVVASAADVYEEFFVPALFGQFAAPLCAAAALAAGERVADVACGTGAATRVARNCVGSSGSVIGIDVNEAMLETAARTVPDVDWRCGRAEELPIEDDAVDVALCQFGLMFFDDRGAALAEMARVVRPGGRIAIATWSELDRSPGYREMTELLRDELGPQAARSLEQPFVLGDPSDLRALLQAAGLRDVEAAEVPGSARFASLRDWLHTDIRGWTLADSIDDETFERLVAAAAPRLGAFVGPTGAVEFAAPALIASSIV